MRMFLKDGKPYGSRSEIVIRDPRGIGGRCMAAGMRNGLHFEPLLCISIYVH